MPYRGAVMSEIFSQHDGVCMSQPSPRGCINEDFDSINGHSDVMEQARRAIEKYKVYKSEYNQTMESQSSLNLSLQ
jgi:hypothetical protein